ncbi:MAG: hydrogenase expression/formation protein HypE [Planctomycetota bacterium]|nr:hydrogenase expression/formation protein HypE [Planctomycetota bacterium]MDE2215829.1 hydrogenase expression/formation protein HypE [Planctomycetota bacterium]
MKHDRILLSHGSGGKLSYQLIHEIFLKAFGNEFLSPLNDQAVFSLPASRLAFTTDSYVVNPIFFPGGDIGKLSVCGTINDLAVGGAEPLYLSVSFIIEEGLLVEELKMVVDSMSRTAKHAGVKIITGDTKVVERGKGDKLFINTTGIGVIKDGINLSPLLIRPGNAIIVSGSIGDHGIAILSHREGIQMKIPVESDCAALHGLVKDVISQSNGILAMRDPTRGGLATTLNELVSSSGCGMIIEESAIPVKEEVKGACEILGFDPLYLANEGKLIAIVSKDSANTVLEAMQKNPLGRNASIIGAVVDAPQGKVLLETSIGNRRILDMLSGEQLPRIC